MYSILQELRLKCNQKVKDFSKRIKARQTERRETKTRNQNHNPADMRGVSI